MRRPRTHRLTGSGPRLLAAATIAALGAVGVVTVASASGVAANSNGASAVAGLHGALVPTPTSCVVGIMCLPTSLPTATPTLPPLHTPTLPPLPLPTTPPVGSICPPGCPSGAGDGSSPSANAGVGSASGGRAGPGGGGTGAVHPGGGAGGGNGSSSASGGSGGGAVQGGGLSLAQPVAIEQLTPLAGISFGQAPYLWPLFLLLDVIAAGAVILAIRKSRSTAGVD